jgi:signal peptidase I
MTSGVSRNRLLRLRRAVNRAVLLFVVLLIVQTWCLEGFFASLQISGPSMALTLFGEHREMVCSDCGFLFACDAARRPISPWVVCPNCGFPRNNLAAREDLGGDRILIDRGAFIFRLPRRWEVIAFRSPRECENIAVKRVVGLPGEIIEIHHGDIYVNGAIARKSLAQQRALLLPVYDARFPPQTLLPPRWTGKSPHSQWGSQAGRFMHPAPEGDSPIFIAQKWGQSPRSPAIDWLVYRHWRRRPGSDAVEVGPVDNVLPYNQNFPYRQENVHPVADLFLTFRVVKITGRGVFWIRASDGQESIQVGIDLPQKKLRAALNEQEKVVQKIELPETTLAGMVVEVSLIDRQFLLALQRQIVCRLPLEPLAGPPPGASEPFAVGSQNLGVILDSLRVFRDVYYTERQDGSQANGGRIRSVLEKNEFFVLGDNSAVSEDSRDWAPGRTAEEGFLIGKPLAAMGSVKTLQWGGLHLPVPNFSRIRWIR